MNTVELLIRYFSYPFVRYAFIAGVLISLCAGLLGVVLVLKRYAMIGDGLSHVAFGAMAIAAVTGLAPMTVALPVTVAAAVLVDGTQNLSVPEIIDHGALKLRLADDIFFALFCVFQYVLCNFLKGVKPNASVNFVS